jgi:hypothetical protein
MMPEEESSNRRQDYRVDDMIPMRDSPISTEEYEIKKMHVGIRSRQGSMLRNMLGKDVFAENSSVAGTEIAKAVEALDAKLNYLIGVNMLNDANRSELKERPVNLSVTGASFVSDERYRKGDPIAVTLMLPVFPPTVLDLIGDVMWARPEKDGRSLIGVHFYYRCSEEEETISQYVFKRDREMIRLKARQEEGI